MQNNSSQADSPQTPTDRYSIGKSSEYLGVSIDTLRRWEKKGVITAYRSPGGHRYFLRPDLDKLFGQKYARVTSTEPKEQPLPTVKPHTISQDITSTPQPPIQPAKVELVPTPKLANVEIPPPPPQSEAIQQRQNLEIKARDLIRATQPSPEPKTKKSIKVSEIPWSKILLIGIVLFVIADLMLLAVFLTSSRPLVSPIP